MRRLFLTSIIVFLLTGLAWCQEMATEETNPCNGTWVLQHRGNWIVTRQEDGLSHVIPTDAVILDCGETPGTLQEHMDNAKAVVRCTNSSEQDGGFHVYEIQIICE